MLKQAVVLGALLLHTTVIRSPSFFQSSLDWDEGLYLLVARSMIGGELPYVAVWDHKPPGIYALYALVLFLSGNSIVAIRIAACLAVAATSFLLYFLTGTQAPTRFAFPLHLIDEKHSAITGVDAIQELAAIMEKKPLYIVKQYEHDTGYYRALDGYLRSDYTFEIAVGDAKLYRLVDIP